MKYFLRDIVLRIWLIIGGALFIIGLVVGTIGMIWLLHWIISGRSFYTDWVNLADKVLPDKDVL